MRLPVEITHLTLVVTRAGMSSGRATTPDLTFDEDGLAGIDSIPIGHGRTAWRRQARSPDEACAPTAFPESFQPQTRSGLARAEEGLVAAAYPSADEPLGSRP